MKTPEDPVTIEPPQRVEEPCTAAGLPLMNTLDEPSTTVLPQPVVSPARAACLPSTVTLGLPEVMVLPRGLARSDPPQAWPLPQKPRA
jgi:hypothetical protein